MAMDKMRTLHDVIQLTNTVGGKVNSGGVQKDLDIVTKCWRNMVTIPCLRLRALPSLGVL